MWVVLYIFSPAAWITTIKSKLIKINYGLNKSWRQHPTRHQLYGHQPPITKTIQVRRTRHAGHCWRSRDELISDVLLWTPTYGRTKAGRPARTYIQQLCENTGCSPEDLPEAMNDREKWRERFRDIRASGTTWWWWWWCMKYLFIVVKVWIETAKFAEWADSRRIMNKCVSGSPCKTPQSFSFYHTGGPTKAILPNYFTHSWGVGKEEMNA